jgi:hypothetical protein
MPDRPVRLLEPLGAPELAAVKALLSDGAAWSVKSLARALGRSERATQRALVGACESGAILALGKGRARRYALPSASQEITTQMLLLGLADPI